MSRSVFGWSYPPGCTSRMVDEAAGVDQPCEVCSRMADDCICPECPTCGDVGNPQCYFSKDGHGMKLNKQQVVERQKGRIRFMEDRLNDERMALDYLESQEEKEWNIEDTPNPWG